METIFDAFAKLSMKFAETGLLLADSAMKTTQASIEALTGQKNKLVTAPPLDGPADLDSAVADWANRVSRIVRMTGMDQNRWGGAAGEILDATRRSFRFLDFTDPRTMLLPVQLPLSFGTLMTQSSLRGIATFSVVGPRRFPRFVMNVLEMFLEVQVYISVQYDVLIKQYEERIRTAPGDMDARIELARILIKLGRYHDSVRELEPATKVASSKALALHETAVACYRGGRYREAMQAASESMALQPDNERTRFWIWHAAQKLGGYPDSVPAWQRMELKAGYDKPTVHFEDVAEKIGLSKTSAGRGSAIFDYNNDGYLDILVAAAHGGCSLFRNNGDGTFTDVSIASGMDECVNGFAITAGDYNNDGYQDVFITRLGFFVGESALYRNNGDGTFTDVTKEAGLNFWGPAFTACWVDYNCDGYLDLYVANNLGGLFDRKSRNLLFRNNGDGTFTEVTEEAGLKTIWPTIGAAWGDYNNDGYPDLFVGNSLGRPQLYRNNRDGTFTDVSEEAGISEFCIGSTAFWCDYNNDGWLDIVHFNWSDHEDVIHTMRFGEGPPDGHPLVVYRNNGDGTFTQVNRDVGINQCWGTMSGSFGDFNNDGNIDFLLGNGSPRMERVEPPILLENDGKKFRNVTFAAGLPFTGKGHGGNMADLHGDGRLSILVASGGAYPGDLLPMSVFRPKSLPGNYLNIRLRGTKSNRDAIGARISLEAAGKKQYREVSGGTNFGCLPTEQHFGLGLTEAVDAIEIRWPSGLRQRLENPPVNTTIRITEGQEGWESVYPSQPARIAAD